MIGCRSWGAMNLTWAVKYAVQAGWARIVLLKWLFPLTGLRATESVTDCRIFGVIIVFVMLMFVAPRFADAVSGL